MHIQATSKRPRAVQQGEDVPPKKRPLLWSDAAQCQGQSLDLAKVCMLWTYCLCVHKLNSKCGRLCNVNLVQTVMTILEKVEKMEGRMRRLESGLMKLLERTGEGASHIKVKVKEEDAGENEEFKVWPSSLHIF